MDDRPPFKFNADNTRDSGCKKVYFLTRDNWCKVHQYKRRHQSKYSLLLCLYSNTPASSSTSNMLLWRHMQPSQIDATNKPVVCVQTKRLRAPGTAAAKLQLTPLQEHWENAGAARAYQMNPPSGSCWDTKRGASLTLIQSELVGLHSLFRANRMQNGGQIIQETQVKRHPVASSSTDTDVTQDKTQGH